MSNKEDILGKAITANKCHDIDPFKVSTEMKKAALQAMEVYGKQCYVDGGNAAHEANKAMIKDIKNETQTRTL